LAVATLLVSLATSATAHAQFFNGNFGRQGVVGGIKIDANGIAADATVADRDAMLAQMKQNIKGTPADFQGRSDLRMVSLKGLQEQISLAKSSGKDFPEEVAVLGGLTAIEYVFVYPDTNDIVIAGPAEEWQLSENGSIVGKFSNKPVLYLDDLLCAFRSSELSRNEGISCSIDPTAEGIEKLNRLLANVSMTANSNFAMLEQRMRTAFGEQTVRFSGMPADSHMAAVLLAADYQMKRLGMNLVKAPVKGLPSYIEMIRNSSAKMPQSRWWMECDYNAIERTEDATVWKISGNGIRALSEESFVDRQGMKTTGRTNAKAQKWADLLTNKMDELTTKEPVFGELKNVMDLTILAALVESHGLERLSGCDLAIIKSSQNSVEIAKLQTPKALPPQCSFIKSAGGWLTTASGGVSLDSWGVAANVKTNALLASVKPAANNEWCWD
jgi:hypothetical protein